MAIRNRTESWEVWVFALCGLWLLLYVANKYDWYNALLPDASAPVHMGKEVTSDTTIPGVSVEDIPEYVYTSLQDETQYQRYFTGNYKYIVMIYPERGHYVSYAEAVQAAVSRQKLDEYYRVRMESLGLVLTGYSCPAKYVDAKNDTFHCATAWLHEHCFNGFCIINPVRKQAVVHHDRLKHDHIASILETYKEW